MYSRAVLSLGYDAVDDGSLDVPVKDFRRGWGNTNNTFKLIVILTPKTQIRRFMGGGGIISNLPLRPEKATGWKYFFLF